MAPSPVINHRCNFFGSKWWLVQLRYMYRMRDMQSRNPNCESETRRDETTNRKESRSARTPIGIFESTIAPAQRRAALIPNPHLKKRKTSPRYLQHLRAIGHWRMGYRVLGFTCYLQPTWLSGSESLLTYLEISLNGIKR